MQYYSKEIKDSIAQQMMECQTEIKVPFYSEESITQLKNELHREYMLLFHINKKYTYHYTDTEAVLKITYLYSKQEYDALSNRIRTLVSKLQQQICTVPSQLEREVRVHDWFCSNVTYADDGAESHTIVGPLLRGRAVCEGIGKAVKFLLNACGIQAHYIAGQAPNENGIMENHGWNVVQIDGKWYHLDVTHDLNWFKDHIRYDYFNLSSREMLKNRTVNKDDPFSLSQCYEERDYYTIFRSYYPTPETFRDYVNQCIIRRTTYIQVRLGEGMSEATVNALFKQCLLDAQISASYQYRFNQKRNVCDWSIQYKQQTVPVPNPQPPTPQPPTPQPSVPQRNAESPYSDAVKAEVARQMKDFQPEIQIPFYSEEAIQALHKELEREDLFLFHLGKTMNYTYSPSRNIALLKPQYLYSKQEYGMLTAQVHTKVQKIKAQAAQSQTQLGRELYIHGLLTKDITYVDDGFESKSIIGPLLKNRGICEGIAKTVKLLFQECGIPTQILSGIPRTGTDGYDGHAWNVVRINGNWYHLDVTADCILTQQHIRYDYFNLCTQEILLDRSIKPDETFPVSQCSHRQDYYDLFGRSFQSTDALMPYLRGCFIRKDTHIQVRMGNHIPAASVDGLFRQVLKGLNINASYRYSTNPTRHIFQWIVQYQ